MKAQHICTSDVAVNILTNTTLTVLLSTGIPGNLAFASRYLSAFECMPQRWVEGENSAHIASHTDHTAGTPDGCKQE